MNKIIFRPGHPIDGLNPKKAFDAWVEAGTTEKAATLLNEYGLRNRRGNPITNMNIWYGAWRWIIDNMTEAKPYFDEDKRLMGEPPHTDEEWEVVVLKKAMSVLEHKKGAFERFLLKHDMQVRYGEIYRYKYPELYRKYNEVQGSSEEEVSAQVRQVQ